MRFEEWGKVVDAEVMAPALIDRLLHHCHIVNFRPDCPPGAPPPLPPKGDTTA